MKLRMGLILASSLAVAAGGCAAGGGSAAPTVTPTPGAEVLAQGERPRDNQFTREAANSLERARDAETPAEAQVSYQAAVVAAQQAIDADPTNPLPHYQQGLAYLGLEDYAAADAALSRAEELRPVYQLETEGVRERAWIALYQEGAPLVNESRFDEAASLFEQANAIYRGRPEVMVVLGQVHTQLGNFDAAAQHLQNALAVIQSERFEEMDSTTQANWRESEELIPTLIAQALMQSGDYDSAASAIEELLAQDPDNLLYLRNLGTLYVQMEDEAGARAIFQRTLEAPGLSNEDYYAVGVGYYQLSDYTDAASAFDEAATNSMNDRDAVEMLTRSLQLAHPPGDEAAPAPTEALEKLAATAERWITLDPGNRNAYLVLAQTSSRLDNQERAAELVSQIEGLSVLVENIQLQRYSDGGGLVSGSVRNVSVDAGSTVTLTIEFYDEAGGSIGSREVSVSAPAADATEAFQVDFVTDQTVGGYGYTISMM